MKGISFFFIFAGMNERCEKIVLPNELVFDEITGLLRQGKRITLRTKGRSMVPFIIGGRDCVVLQQRDSLAVGDIVLAHVSGKGYLLHRIIRLNGDRVLLMGDGNVAATETCLRNEVCGVVTEIIRNGRSVCCASAAERRKVVLWLFLKPVRRYILGAGRRLGLKW